MDGLRLDAVPYLFEREGTNCENLPETHAALKEIRAPRRRALPGQDAAGGGQPVAGGRRRLLRLGTGDECHTAFHFPLMPRMFMGIRTEDRYPIVDMLEQTPAIPESCQWVLFLRNHDELTLEMVTDEERDYMYRVYAQDQQARINLGIRRRLAPLLGNSRRKIELMNGLLLSLPGTPVIYYGDEIGMGDNFYLGRPQRRAHARCSGAPTATRASRAPTRRSSTSPVIIDPEYHYEAVNVEVQQDNPQSLLWWTKRILSLRKQYKAFGRGSLEFLHPDNNKVLAFVRAHGDERILVVANLSRFAQHVELNLSAFKGLTPVEMFGRNAFPAVGEAPYPAGPRARTASTGSRWRRRPPARARSPPPPCPSWSGAGRSTTSCADANRDALEAVLPGDPAHAPVVPRPASATRAVGGDRGAGRRSATRPASPSSAWSTRRARPETYVMPLAAGRGHAGGRPAGAVAAGAAGPRARRGRGGRGRPLRPALGPRLLRGAARLHGAQAAARRGAAQLDGLVGPARSAARATRSRAPRPA